MRFQNKAKPIKFCLSVGDKECRSVEDVKNNFVFDSLYDSFKNGTLQKWLKQIGESSLLNRIDDFSSQDLLAKKVRLYNLFSPEPLSSDEVNDDNVLQLLTKGCINIGDLSDTPFADNIEIKKSVIENTDNETLNRWCENDLELLMFVYSKKSYGLLNAQNCRILINQKIVTNEDLVMKIATEKNLDDILERFGKLTVMLDRVAIEMILVKGYSGGDFYIGKYPVTQAQWQAIMGNNPSIFKNDEHPVEQVTWNDCLAFIYKLNKMYGRKFRLPKEAEWEFAARGGNKTHYYTYSGSDNIDEVGWYAKNSHSMTYPVGKKKSNELGIYDMCGNVWELCEDFFYSTGRGHVMRGGSWVSGAHECTIRFRGNCYDPDRKGFGLRLAMDA